MVKWWPEVQGDAPQESAVSAVLAASWTVRGEEAFSVVRIALSGWTTSHRLHSEIGPKCLFGCGGEPRNA